MLHRAPHDHGIQPSPARASCPRGPPSRHISNHKMEKDTQPHPGHTTPTTLPASEFKESIQGYGSGGGPGGQSKTFQKSRTQVQNHIKNCPEKDACRSVPWPLARPQAASVPRRVAVSASCKCAPRCAAEIGGQRAADVPLTRLHLLPEGTSGKTFCFFVVFNKRSQLLPRRAKHSKPYSLE